VPQATTLPRKQQGANGKFEGSNKIKYVSKVMTPKGITFTVQSLKFKY
jgi:hypothetical protein